MEIKQEPEDSMKTDMLESCCLCPEGREVLSLLAKHFETIHSNVLHGSFTHFCNCFEGLRLQANLINHLLSHILGRDEPLEFHTQFANTTVFASNFCNTNPFANQEHDVEVKNEPELQQEDSIPSSYNYESSETNTVQYQSVYPRERRKRTVRGAVADSYSFDETAQKFSCNLCGRLYGAKFNVRKHLHEKHSHINSKVKLKEVSVASKTSAEEGKRFYCNACPKDFSSKQGMEKHQNNEHNPNNSLKCDKCPASLATLKLFHAHAKTHEPKLEEPENGALQCNKCFKTYETPKQLYHHMLLHREKLLSCDFCGENFNFKTKLMHHLFRHVGIKYDKNKAAKERIVCDQCSELVPKYNMKRHIMMRHDKVRPYKCEQLGCESAFSESRHLNEHMNIHKGLKPFICEFCSMGFHHLSALRSHRLRHTDPEKYKCEICAHFFVTKESLRKHKMRQHSTETGKDVRPFACDHPDCTSAFRFPDHLQRHKKTVHEEKLVNMSCHLCNFTANKAKNYFQHMRRTHGVKKRLHNRVFPSNENSTVLS